MPAILELRIRACHVRGSFGARTTSRRRCRRGRLMAEPARVRLHAAGASAGDLRPREAEESSSASRRRAATSSRHKLNEHCAGSARRRRASSCRAACYNAPGRRAAAARPRRRVRQLATCRCWCSTSPTRWCPTSSVAFCAGKRAVLVFEEGQPEYIEQRPRHDAAAAATCNTPLHGKDLLPAGRRVHGRGDGCRRCCEFVAALPAAASGDRRQSAWLDGIAATRRRACAQRARQRRCRRGRRAFASVAPSGRCSRRSKLAQQRGRAGAHRGRHRLPRVRHLRAVLASGHSILGYGMSLASRAGVSPVMAAARAGDHGRRRLLAQRAAAPACSRALFNGDDAVLLILKNGYTSATGTQDIISTPDDEAKASAPTTRA